jgi:hypothetical protein
MPAAFLLAYVTAVPCRAQDKVTILYDAFGESKERTKDWGFSALVEHNERRILFDTENGAAILEHNLKALSVDLTKLDFLVISHRQADHTMGLKYLLKVNPSVTVYVPADGGNGCGERRFQRRFCGQMRACPRRCGISGERIRNISHGARCLLAAPTTFHLVVRGHYKSQTIPRRLTRRAKHLQRSVSPDFREAQFVCASYQAVFCTRLLAFTLPMPVAMSQPGVAPNAG